MDVEPRVSAAVRQAVDEITALQAPWRLKRRGPCPHDEDPVRCPRCSASRGPSRMPWVRARHNTWSPEKQGRHEQREEACWKSRAQIMIVTLPSQDTHVSRYCRRSTGSRALDIGVIGLSKVLCRLRGRP